MPGVFMIERDARGSLVHVRRRDDGECVGCIEVGLFEIVRAVLAEDLEARAREGIPARASADASYHDGEGG